VKNAISITIPPHCHTIIINNYKKAPNNMTKANFKIWLKAASVRAVRTMAQTFLASLGSTAILSTVDWKVLVSAAVMAGLLSVLTSLSGLPEIKE
jgi:hypothetical protein